MEVKGEIEEDSSRNLLQRFGGVLSGDAPPEVAGGGDTFEVELSLGLSLNGCFGAEPKEKRLTRTSSISSFSLFPIEHNVPLTRTCSLPSETEEVRRKRKEVESFKRMEVKRKRSEKKVVKDRKDEDFDDDLNNLRNGQNDKGGQVFAGKMSGIAVNGRRTTLGAQGSCSSSVLDFESKPTQGIILSASNQTNQKASTDKNVTAIASASNHTNQKVSATAEVKREGDEPSRKKSCRTNGMRESERNMMEEMPCVSTKGDGPDGRRVEGFLYRYRKGEVRIVCVCHGQFLTPAEFVKHARGGDVAHPLRHIVVNSTPAFF